MTTPARTAFDIGRRLERDRAVPILDALCAATNTPPHDIADVARHHPRLRGVRRLAEVIRFVDSGAESPPESLTRLLLVDDGLPCPTTQLVVRDHTGQFVARVDMGWDDWRVAVEYDGAHHWTDPAQRAEDINRLAALESLGWRVVRVSATLLHCRPYLVTDRVRAALHAQGAALNP
ncbi:endonuclease domain-containing protein [Nocardia sp. NBC_01388]|uniref:endonuclease domain-containing protein n=1 Tax=Nocardia sp. NBC_01388 TaxID=2903596 RepID=UPI00324C2586